MTHLAEILPIALLGTIPAGLPEERGGSEGNKACENIGIDRAVYIPTRNTFALRMVGDSMVGKHILDGDIVILEHGPDPRSGQVVAALIDGKSVLRTFVVRNGKPFVCAANPKYPAVMPSEELMIQGVARMIVRRAKGFDR